MRHRRELGAEACFAWDNTSSNVAPTEAVEGWSLASTYEISAELVEKQIRKLPNKKGGPSLKIPGENTASDGLHAGAVAECWKRTKSRASKLSDCFQVLLDNGWCQMSASQEKSSDSEEARQR